MQYQTIAGVIEVYDNAIAEPEKIISIVEALEIWKDSEVGSQNNGAGVVNKDTRDNKVAVISPFDFRTPLELYLFAKDVWSFLDDYAIRHDTSFSAMEPYNINKYQHGERYIPHADAGPGVPRHISALVYLNDVAEGGETEFTYFNVRVAPKAGRLVIFPSTYAYTHEALPPRQGTKYSAAFWCHA